jgi:hypothetical protein
VGEIELPPLEYLLRFQEEGGNFGLVKKGAIHMIDYLLHSLRYRSRTIAVI